jgi:hypothetical protein
MDGAVIAEVVVGCPAEPEAGVTPKGAGPVAVPTGIVTAGRAVARWAAACVDGVAPGAVALASCGKTSSGLTGRGAPPAAGRAVAVSLSTSVPVPVSGVERPRRSASAGAMGDAASALGRPNETGAGTIVERAAGKAAGAGAAPREGVGRAAGVVKTSVAGAVAAAAVGAVAPGAASAIACAVETSVGAAVGIGAGTVASGARSAAVGAAGRSDGARAGARPAVVVAATGSPASRLSGLT